MPVLSFIYLFLNIACIGALVYLIVLLAPHRQIPASKAFLLLASLLILWITTLANQATLVFSESQVIFMHRLAESIFLFIPIALMLLVDKFATVSRLMSKWVFLLFGGVLLILLTLIWTNQFHHLYWKVETVMMVGTGLKIAPTRTLFSNIVMALQHLEIVFCAFHFLGLTITLNRAYQKLTRLINIILVLTALSSATMLLSAVEDPYHILPTILTAFTISLAHLIINHNIFDLALILRISYFDELADGALIVATTGTIIDMSKQFEDQVGHRQAQEMVGKDLFKYFPDWKGNFDNVLRTQKNQTISYHRTQGIETFQYDVTMSPNKDGYGFVSTVLIKLQDVTFYHQLLEQVNELAIRDSLTGILNRRHFELLVQDHLKLAQRYQRVGCLLMIDLDEFKHINDFYGHQIGDKLLTEFCHQMNSLMRESDIFARYGGDEFLLYLPETDWAGAITVINHMGTYIKGTLVEIEGETLPLKCSVGCIPITPMTINLSYEQLVSLADKAMYGAKAQGPNTIGYIEGDQIKFHLLD